MLRAVFSLCYGQFVVCVMCSLQSVLCAVFSLCYVQSLVCLLYSLQLQTSSLPSEHASARLVGKSPTRARGRAQGNAKYHILCAGPRLIVSVHETNERVPCIFVCFAEPTAQSRVRPTELTTYFRSTDFLCAISLLYTLGWPRARYH